jgi:hypothetical protein
MQDASGTGASKDGTNVQRDGVNTLGNEGLVNTRPFKWTVEITLDEWMVADGADLTDERMHNILMRAFVYARGSEVACKVTARPSDEAIAAAQGFDSVEGWRQFNSRKGGV